jgi:TolA-binding protein
MPPAAAEDELDRLAREAAAQPASVPHRLAYAEACLRECRLERGLAAFREVLALDPDHTRARAVIDRLGAGIADLETHLAVLERLVADGITTGLDAALDTASVRAIDDAQRARIGVLRAQLALLRGETAAARVQLLAWQRLHPATTAAARATLLLAQIAADTGDDVAADRLFAVAQTHPDAPPSVTEAALLGRVRWETQAHDLDRQIAALTAIEDRCRDPEVRAEYFTTVIPLLRERSGDGATAIEALGRWAAGIDGGDDRQLVRLLAAASGILATDPGPRALDLADLTLAALPTTSRSLGVARDLLRVEVDLRRIVLATDAAQASTFAGAAQDLLAALAAKPLTGEETVRERQLAERILLAHAQKLAVLGDSVAALPVLRTAAEIMLARAGDQPDPGMATRLRGIGRLYEGLGEWELATEHQRRLTLRFPHLPLGRDALLRQAEITERHLRDERCALALYADYAGRYPAELTYRQMRLGDRLARLGYDGVIDFQRRNLLPADGIAGRDTLRRLAELETTYDLVALDAPVTGPEASLANPPATGRTDRAGASPLRGVFVHPRIFDLAQGLERRGRHHDAIGAYRLFLNLFPTKQEADDALLAIARIFRDNGLFAEALGAYRQLIDDFPKGDRTSEGYVEGARCLIDLGRWRDARDLLALYIKQFPRKEHVKACRQDIAALEELMQYADFIAGHAGHPKLAEAGYQIGAILYKRLSCPRRAAVELSAVADAHPDHVRAADALYTAGTAWLHLESFPAARTAFAAVVAKHPDNRLADDAQFWIGHSYEYAARALGQLDAARIVLKRRSLASRRALLADLPLRRLYHPAAAADPVADAAAGADTDGLLAGVSIADRVSEDLTAAIAAYRAVADRFQLGDKAGNALLRIGTIYTDYLKNTDKAVEAYRELLAKYPGSQEAVDALFNVGAHQREAKRYEEAISSYKKFIFSYPEARQTQQAMVDIAACFAAQGQWDQALDAYKSYLNKFPEGTFARIAETQIEWIRMYYF